MSQKTTYECDECKKTIGDNPHISLQFTNYSGISLPPKSKGNISPYWAVSNSMNGKFMHFCNGKCIGDYFGQLMKPKAKLK